ncbi:MAG: SDR family oxidoreductase [Candidatus Kapaibacterium sp.]
MSVVFITGAGKRIGKSLAINFAKKGWDVAINYNSSESLALETADICRTHGVQAKVYKADVSNKAEIIKAIDKSIEELGLPDVLVNNAGVFPERTKIADIEESLIDSTFGINLKGEFFTSQYFSQLAKPNSRIINIASLGAYEIWKGRLPYHVSKSALIQMTRALAVELAPNISVNSVSPGAIKVKDDPAKDSSLISVDKIPMKRYGTPEDIFDAVYFFATTTSYITAQNITVDGGYHYSR